MIGTPFVRITRFFKLAFSIKVKKVLNFNYYFEISTITHIHLLVKKNCFFLIHSNFKTVNYSRHSNLGTPSLCPSAYFKGEIALTLELYMIGVC